MNQALDDSPARSFAATGEAALATARSRDGTRVRYAVVGEGEPVVLLHPFSEALESWWDNGIAPRLAATRQVIAIDARGHGGSDKPRDKDRYTLGRRIEDVLAVLDAAAVERAHAIGYSMGGWTALGLLGAAPERLRSLVVGGAHPYAQTLDLLRGALAGGLDRWRGVVERSLGALSPGQLARLTRNDQAALTAVAAEDRADVSAPLVSFTAPVLWVTGERDPARAAITRAAATCTCGRLTVVPAADHFQTFLHPAFADAVVEFVGG